MSNSITGTTNRIHTVTHSTEAVTLDLAKVKPFEWPKINYSKLIKPFLISLFIIGWGFLSWKLSDQPVFQNICIILLVNILFYAKTICYKYVSDDIPSSQRKEDHPKWKYWLLVLEGHLKSTPQIDHFITTILHALVCVFIYTGFGATDISFLAALLFAFNPINNQGAVWISGRGYVLSALGMLLALTFPKIGLLWLLLATYSNAGFLAPIALIGSPHPWLLALAPLCWAFWFKNFRKNVAQKIDQEMYTHDKKIHPVKLVIAIKTFAFYLTHALIPIKTTFYHSYMQSMAGAGRAKAESMKDRFFWIGLVAIGLILWRFLTHEWDMVNFGLLWWCVCLAPFCNLMRMQQEISERYCYLPNVGLMIVLAYVLYGCPILIPAFIAMYATKTWFYIDYMQDDYYLVEGACLNSPDSWFAWHVRAMKRWDNQSYQEAVILWTMARLISPNEFKINFNLATALKLAKHEKEALMFLDLAQKHVPAGQEEQTSKLVEDWKKGQLAVVL